MQKRQHDAGAKAEDEAAGRVDWIPAHRLRRYLWAKAVGGLLVAVIFAGWLVIQWSNVAMRVTAAALIVLTAWIVAGSILADLARARGRRLWIGAGELCVEEEGELTRVLLDAIASAQWNGEGEDAGMTLLDAAQRPLARLDARWLDSEDEARTFLGWLREHGGTNFPVRWA